MAPQVILHIGMHKTGTTSIQATLQDFDDGGVRYARLNDQNHSIPIYSQFSSDKYDYHIHKGRGRGKEEIDKINASTIKDLEHELSLQRDTIIVSGEDISTLDPAGVEALITWLKPRVAGIRIIAYVRPPEGFASSGLQQYIMGGMRKISFPSPDYRKRFEAFVNNDDIDSIEFVEFGKDTLANGSVVSDFCSRVGIDERKLNEKRTNESISLQCTQLIYHFNRLGVPSKGSALLSNVRNHFTYRLRMEFKGEKFKIPDEWIWAGSDMEDLAWMEKVSGIALVPEDVARQAIERVDISPKLEEMLGCIEKDTLTHLQEYTSRIDDQISQDTNATNLLNFVFAATYFEKKGAPTG